MARRNFWVGILFLGVIISSGCSTMPSSQVVPYIPQVASGNGKSPLELPPNEAAKACLTAAELLEKNGQVPEAIALYERARSKNRNLLKVGRRLAALYDKHGDFVRAQEEYEKALKLYPNDSDLLNDLGYSYYMRGDLVRSEEKLRHSLKIKPENKRAWVNLGMVLGQQKRYDESLQAFQQAVKPAQAYSNLGFIMTAQGNREGARQAYHKALALNPNLPIARGALVKLEMNGRKDLEPLPPEVTVQYENAPVQATGTPEMVIQEEYVPIQETVQEPVYQQELNSPYSPTVESGIRPVEYQEVVTVPSPQKEYVPEPGVVTVPPGTEYVPEPKGVPVTPETEYAPEPGAVPTYQDISNSYQQYDQPAEQQYVPEGGIVEFQPDDPVRVLPSDSTAPSYYSIDELIGNKE